LEKDWSEKFINYWKDSLLHLTLALQSLLAILELLDALNVTYFPTIHRATIRRTFSLGFSLAPALLLLSSITIAYLLRGRRHLDVLVLFSASLGLYMVFGLGVSAALLSVMLVSVTLLRFRGFQDYAFWIFVLATGFEGLAFLHWILLPFGISSPMAWLADLELSLFYVVAPLAPLIAAAIMCMWFLRPLIRYVGIDKLFASRLNLESVVGGKYTDIHPIILLTLALFFSVFMALYPYSPNINPNSVPVGVDVHWYVDWVSEIGRNPYNAFMVANGSRSVILLLIYAFKHLSGSSVLEAVKYLPVLLNPLLTLSVYFMVSQASEDRGWASLASLFTAMGFKTTVGMYSYFLTNILGLVLIFLATGLLFNTLNTGSKFSLVSASALGSIAVFTHPWTFIQYYAVTALFFGYSFFRGKLSSRYFNIFLYLCVTGFVDFLKGIVIGGLDGVGALAIATPRLMYLVDFWSNNVFIFRLKYGGFLSNVVLLGLAALGVYKMKVGDDFKLFLISLLCTSSLFYFVTYEEIISRLLYNIPLEVFAAIGLLFLLRNDYIKIRNRRVLSIFIKIYMVVYLLRSIGNLV